MALYECTFIARQDLSRAEINRLVETFTETLTAQGGKIVHAEQWGLRTLAYKINKNRKGHYVMLAIDAEPQAMKELERTMRINEEIVRILTVRVEAHDEEPSAMMSQRSGRDDSESDTAPQPFAAPTGNETDAA